MRPLLAVLLVACGGPPKPDCSLNRLDELKAEYVRDLVNACRDVPTEEPCPKAAELRKAFDAKELEWSTCRQQTN